MYDYFDQLAGSETGKGFTDIKTEEERTKLLRSLVEVSEIAEAEKGKLKNRQREDDDD